MCSLTDCENNRFLRALGCCCCRCRRRCKCVLGGMRASIAKEEGRVVSHIAHRTASQHSHASAPRATSTEHRQHRQRQRCAIFLCVLCVCDLCVSGSRRGRRRRFRSAPHCVLESARVSRESRHSHQSVRGEVWIGLIYTGKSLCSTIAIAHWLTDTGQTHQVSIHPVIQIIAINNERISARENHRTSSRHTREHIYKSVQTLCKPEHPHIRWWR